MKTRNAIALGTVGVSVLAGFLGCSRAPSPQPTAEPKRLGASAPTGAIPITISSPVPTELNQGGGGAPKATLQQAAAFAWQEFIALNWPAVNQTGGVVNNSFVRQRDVPDSNCKFGDPNCAERPPGATIPVTTLCDLAHAWWHDRLAPDWGPHTREQNQAILDRVGLTGEFWRLP